MSIQRRKFSYLLMSLLLLMILTATGIAIAGASTNSTAVKSASAAAARPASVPSNLNITPGSDASQLNFDWSTAALLASPQVQVAKASDMKGSAFPASKSKTYYGVSIKAYVTPTPKTASDPLTTVEAGFYQSKVTVSGLKNCTA
jgi:hypothetical protein